MDLRKERQVIQNYYKQNPPKMVHENKGELQGGEGSGKELTQDILLIYHHFCLKVLWNFVMILLGEKAPSQNKEEVRKVLTQLAVDLACKHTLTIASRPTDPSERVIPDQADGLTEAAVLEMDRVLGLMKRDLGDPMFGGVASGYLLDKVKATIRG